MTRKYICVGVDDLLTWLVLGYDPFFQNQLVITLGEELTRGQILLAWTQISALHTYIRMGAEVR